MPKTKKFVFLDTNIFLHFQFFTEIPWNELLKVHSVILVVPPIILKELDKHKYNHPSEKIKDRAKKVTKKLAELLRSKSEVRSKVKIQFERIEPQSEFQEYHLSKDSQDDHLIASILRFQSETKMSPILISNDFSLIMKAHLLDVEVFELPDEYQNKSEENTDKKKIKNLEAEIIELKNKIPKLKAVFSNGEQKLFCTTLQEKPPTQEDINKQIKQKEEYYKPINLPEEKLGEHNQSVRIESVNSHYFVEFWKAKNYNESIKIYLQEETKYINAKAKIEELKSRTIQLDIKLVVEGNSPANEINLFLTFPTNIRVFKDKTPFIEPEFVTLPNKPGYSDDLKPYEPYSSKRLLEMYPNSTEINRHTFSTVDFPEISSWATLEKIDLILLKQDRIRYSVLKLSHGYGMPLKPIFVEVENIKKPSSFEITYMITADNLPTPAYGTLNVIIKDKSNGKKK